MNRNSRRGMYLEDDVNVTINPTYDHGQEDVDQAHQPGQKGSANLGDYENTSSKLRTSRIQPPSHQRWSHIVWEALNSHQGVRQNLQVQGNCSDQINASQTQKRRFYSWKEVFCFVLVPLVLLSILAIGVCSIFIYVHLLQEYQDKIERLQDSLSRAKVQLSSETAKATDLERILKCIESVMKKNGFNQIFEIEREVSVECHGVGPDEIALPVADEAVVNKRHKVEKKRLVPDPTTESSQESFLHGMSSSPSKLVSLVGTYVDQQSNFCSKLSSSLGSNLDRRSKEKGVFTNTYTEAVTKLIEISSEIERVASGNMYKEQAWVEKLLKRLRNEADTQSQSIHKFLVDNLLAMHTDVLASVGNLRKTVQELAVKTDKTLDNRLKVVNLHLVVSEKEETTSNEQSIEVMTKLDQRNNLISQTVKSDETYTTEYIKKSSAIVSQFKGLLAALVDTEQRFLSEAKKSRMTVLEQTAKTNEDLTTFQIRRKEKESKFFSSRDKLKNELDQESSKFGVDKGLAMESLGINFAKVSDSVEKIREQAETFVNRGKDAWNLHYAETETALRQRSDAALQHVTDLQGKTQKLKFVSRDSQSNLESILESARVADERDVQGHRVDIASKCLELTNFANQFRDELRQADHVGVRRESFNSQRLMVSGGSSSEVSKSKHLKKRDFNSENVYQQPVNSSASDINKFDQLMQSYDEMTEH